MKYWSLNRTQKKPQTHLDKLLFGYYRSLEVDWDVFKEAQILL